MLQILICRSYKTKEDLAILEKLRDKLRTKGITGTFLMKDIRIVDEKDKEIKLSPHEKMHSIWNVMKEGDNFPLFILFAGKSASESLGLNAEIQTIAHDKEKIDCAHLFKITDVELVSHEECFSSLKEIEDGNEFIVEAEKIVDVYLKQAKMFYRAKREEK